MGPLRRSAGNHGLLYYEGGQTKMSKKIPKSGFHRCVISCDLVCDLMWYRVIPCGVVLSHVVSCGLVWISCVILCVISCVIVCGVVLSRVSTALVAGRARNTCTSTCTSSCDLV